VQNVFLSLFLKAASLDAFLGMLFETLRDELPDTKFSLDIPKKLLKKTAHRF